MERCTAWIPGPPVPKSRPKMGRGHAYTPKRTADYERLVAERTKEIHISGSVALTVGFVMPIRKSWSKKKQAEMIGQPHTFTPDLDNLLKSIMDGMSQCWANDCKVFQVHTWKIYGVNPGALISVETYETELTGGKS